MRVTAQTRSRRSEHSTIVVEFLVRESLDFRNDPLGTAAKSVVQSSPRRPTQAKAKHLKKLQCHPASSNFVNRSRSMTDLTCRGGVSCKL
jgi:hypothetical protein